MANSKYQRELLNESGAEMLNICLSQLEKAKEAFINHDSDLAEEVIINEVRVNALDIRIEKSCEKFLALYNPVAIDLRFIMAIRKINFDLERIADHACSISKYVVEHEKEIDPELLKALQIQEMFETSAKMIDKITEAYEKKDVKIARKVFKQDKVLDKINIESYKIIENEIIKNNKVIADTLLLFSVIKKMERVGDLIKNIAEEIIFYIDAEVVKHKKKK
jgi:phosphate transport system protein|tara:strand:+ start:797 stop:1459 length:663 start_codon:yes stop_codon:yes gene_type:complete